MDERTEYFCFNKECHCYFTKGKASEGLKCPNCNDQYHTMSCDSFDFVLYKEKRKERKLKDLSWTKAKFVSECALEKYKEEGIEIRE